MGISPQSESYSAPDLARPAPSSWLPSAPLAATLALAAAGVVVIGLAPGLLIDVAEEAVWVLW